MPQTEAAVFFVMTILPRLIGMVHLEALPGTPQHTIKVKEMIQRAVGDARTLQEGGMKGILIENMHDRPYQAGGVGPEIVAAMTMAATAVRQATGLPCGVQVLAAANREALAIALAADLQFIRAEAFVFAHIADEGLLQSCAADLLRYRRNIGAESVFILTDIKKKHSAHAITSDISLEETAHAAEYFLSDGLIVTGLRTGYEPDVGEVRAVQTVSSLPVFTGSGVTPHNIAAFLEAGDGVIVGSSLKVDGDWRNPVDPARVRALCRAATRS
jgi:membrane complex biogenesis BtpA family protein